MISVVDSNWKRSGASRTVAFVFDSVTESTELGINARVERGRFWLARSSQPPGVGSLSDWQTKAIEIPTKGPVGRLYSNRFLMKMHRSAFLSTDAISRG